MGSRQNQTIKQNNLIKIKTDKTSNLLNNKLTEKTLENLINIPKENGNK